MITIDIFHTAFEDLPEHVATLNHDGTVEAALEAAFAGTQNVESSWVTSNGQNAIAVKPTSAIEGRQGCRSTSVGDYVRVNENGQESFWRCCGAGWKPIANLQDLKLVGSQAMLSAYGR